MRSTVRCRQRLRALPVLLLLLISGAHGAAQPAAAPLLWFRQGQPTPQALTMLAAIRAADRYGLQPADYDAETLNSQVARLAAPSGADAQAVRQLDTALSAAVLRFATQLHAGRVNARSAGFNLERPRPAVDGPAILSQLAASANPAAELRALEPPFLHYQLLKDALQRYRLLAGEPGLTNLPPFRARSLQPGDRYAGAPALRRLLRAVADLDLEAPEPSDPQLLDPALCAALRQFQTRHGLAPDGALGQATYRALTVPMASRARQIELTLERWRWLPPFTTPPIIVNIPQFRLFAFRTTEDRVADILQMSVIVGRIFPRNRTPVFISDLRYVVFRPYWDVPPSIVRNEMLVAMRKSSDYLVHNNLELVRGEGDDGTVVAPSEANIDALAHGELRLRQRPGADNALGLIKFLMPNGYNVYLHSTPEQHLFNAAQRAYSHGCIRVADPVALAVHVLRGNGGEWTSAAVDAAMHGEVTQRVALAEPIPVLVLYGTALAKEDGQVMFFDDIYGHDRRLERLLRTAAR
jgi:murein L,D-transpeptidase YcbB/YkuD